MCVRSNYTKISGAQSQYHVSERKIDVFNSFLALCSIQLDSIHRHFIFLLRFVSYFDRNQSISVVVVVISIVRSMNLTSNVKNDWQTQIFIGQFSHFQHVDGRRRRVSNVSNISDRYFMFDFLVLLFALKIRPKEIILNCIRLEFLCLSFRRRHLCEWAHTNTHSLSLL